MDLEDYNGEYRMVHLYLNLIHLSKPQAHHRLFILLSHLSGSPSKIKVKTGTLVIICLSSYSREKDSIRGEND